jgi:hypothetical protein
MVEANGDSRKSLLRKYNFLFNEATKEPNSHITAIKMVNSDQFSIQKEV